MKLRLLILSAMLAATIGSSSLSARTPLAPKIGETAGSSLSVADEQIYGDQIMQQIRRSEFLINDPLIADYIYELGSRLVVVNPDALGRRFNFFILLEPSINAFALPGGYIGIHSGLFTASETESELASVLGHEIAHVTQRHLARRIERQNDLSIATMIGMIGSVLIAAYDPEAGMAAMTASQAASSQSIINHTRSNESEADRIGVKLLSKAGFDVRGAAQFFETLQQASRFSPKPPEILLTHPLSRNRIAEARTHADFYPKTEHESSVDYQLIKSRIASLESRLEAKQLKLKLREYNSGSNKFTLGESYHLALELDKAGNVKGAIRIIDRLYAQYPENTILLFSLSELHQKQGTSRKVLSAVLEQLDKQPQSTRLLLAASSLLIENKRFSSAESLLLRHLDTHRNNPNYLFLLAKVQNSLNKQTEAHETTGQYLLLLGDIRTAKRHFELALINLSDDPHAKTRVQARLSDAKKRLREIQTQRK